MWLFFIKGKRIPSVEISPNIYKPSLRSNFRMTSGNEYEDAEEYEVRLLRDIRDRAGSIDEKVDYIRDEITEFFRDYRHRRDEWDVRDLNGRGYRR
ncbi:hypothetical protein AKJ51_02385 [candidate division MSBL1 archaeon SCGC-AAA382A20]|uniref:Uncharacterized protein n=1 Tax=candidate division MSBL1 archaeon SCGC-AAA382A20 TaxID=1698280 RepID=A0A133VKI8_9EURY|nr:hypothetical protein AKJ51_02385 [candidate division MSBL1 archaeon SCGC-AAA382A20]